MYTYKQLPNGWYSVGRYGSNGAWVKKGMHRSHLKAQKHIERLNTGALGSKSHLFKWVVLLIGVLFSLVLLAALLVFGAELISKIF